MSIGFGAAVVCVALAWPGSLLAQTADDRQSHFGVIFSVSPESEFNEKLKFLFDAERVDIRSRDLEIGFIIRGRQLGGDWGVSYIQKRFKDGSIVDRTGESDGLTFGTRYSMQDVQLRGLSIHKFAPFVTIKRRVQIGINFGGGVTWPEGTAERRDFGVDFVPPNTQVQTETVSQVDAKEVFLEDLSPMPVWKVELAGAVLVAPGLKVRVGGGMNWGNYPAFTITGLYLFGAK
jgi:hypothetical protein